jgi:hypothetical protein
MVILGIRDIIKKFPTSLPKEFEEIIGKRKGLGKRDYLRAIHDDILEGHKPGIFLSYVRSLELFDNDIFSIWKRKKNLSCLIMNYLMATAILKSGKFAVKDLSLKWTLIMYFHPHQYIRVRIGDNEYINVDPWAAAVGLHFGEVAEGFNYLNFLTMKKPAS